MRKREVSSTLTVYHDGQFWVGVVEHVESGMLSVARVVFGAEPSNEEVYAWVLERWTSLHLSTATEPVESHQNRLPGNPKRRARGKRPYVCEAPQPHRNVRSLASGNARRMRPDQSVWRAAGKRRSRDGKNAARKGVASIAGNEQLRLCPQGVAGLSG